VDVLEREAVEQARRTLPGERARQALDAMKAGFRLKRAALRARHPGESESQIDARFRRWLERDDRG
jgi:Rv0078B-related antitoxin